MHSDIHRHANNGGYNDDTGQKDDDNSAVGDSECSNIAGLLDQKVNKHLEFFRSE